jgi:integrase
VALLLIGWKAALRTDDLARLAITDLAVSEDGLTVHYAAPKPTRPGPGTRSASPPPTPTAPRRGHRVDAVAQPAGLPRSAHRTGLARHRSLPPPPRATRLTTRSLGTIITTRAAAAGLDGDIGGHSLRGGFATSALAGGASERAVQRHGRWRPPVSMAGYIEEAQRFDDTNPTRFLRP